MWHEHSVLRMVYGDINLNRKRYETENMDAGSCIILAALLLWWLFWAILIDEDGNALELPNTEIIE